MSLKIKAQELPPIQIFTPDVYGSQNQNWSISQSQDKLIYVGNNKGLLEFNGEEWRLYETPNKTIVRAVNVIDNRIYTGCYREFGYWLRDKRGVLNYISISKQLNIPFLEDEEIWNIINVDDFVIFQSLRRIYIYNEMQNTYKIIDSETVISKSFKVDNRVYFQKSKDGVYEIQKGSAKLISNDIILKENLLVNMFKHNENLLLQTQDQGFYILKNNELSRWNIEAASTLLGNRIYSSTKLQDGSFVLGSISNGILHLTPEGKINYKISQRNGLSSNTVLSVFEDIDNNIWLGLEFGINCINIKSPFRIFNDSDGKIGSVNASIVFNGNLYLGTNRGLFYRTLSLNTPFKFISGSQGAVWTLKNINGTLFCGHDSGTFVVKNNSVDLIADVTGTWEIKSLKKTNNTLIQGNYDGLYVLEKDTSGKWTLKNKIEGFETSSRYFEMINDTTLLLNHEYKGVFKITLNSELTKASVIPVKNSKNLGESTSLVKYNQNILYAHKKGVFRYNLEGNQFVKDSILSNLIDTNNYTSGRLIVDANNNKLWSFNKLGINFITSNSLSGVPKINNIPLPNDVRKDVVGFENINQINATTYLYGTSSGYMLIDLNNLINREHSIKINQVLVANSKNAEYLKYIDASTVGQFKNNENNLEFHYSVPIFNKYQVAEYQYKLEGIYDEWSRWSTNSTEVFENLPFGDYTFHVRSRIGNEISKNTASFSFNIEVPWFLTKQMIAVYVLLIILFSLFMHNVYKRYYRKQREKLLKKTERELELKELENKQQLMRFNNEKLRQDIESKNRELATSTMSLIKKNEFLNSIKGELKNLDGGKDVKKVIKIIDRNLNNNDDWHTFEEAFNNADKDFLKKMKAEHPTLTSNDLRLCAYLRLNLSSKEIAPLLNISPRSVEVKRYRLRKKLELPHESGLTDYILEI
ncbi:LuxR C-terminal-related transcriptional regulator [Flavobacteriaceae bacterium GSB9]|nr:LuxR C-terminal-related transcriptional regulator [Flavobacteriaceae bacterium GSB9]